MMNTEMSSNTQHHPLASDRKEISPDTVGSICGFMNQKNVWLQKNGRSSLLPVNSISSNSSSSLHDQSSQSFQSSLVANDGSNNSNKSSNLNEKNQSMSAFLVCQDTPFSFKSSSLVSITTSNIASKASDCCSLYGSNSMSSLSLTTAKYLRNVVPYTIIPLEKQGIQGNAEKFKDTTYTSVLLPSIIAHTDAKKW
jgi:hypothetical protein